MAQNSGFGAQLRAARTQQGMGLDEAGRRLRIDPTILEAIENENFSAMPPKNTTRLMVNAYSQLVGLNSTALTRQYLDEEYRYQQSVQSNDYFSAQLNQQNVQTRSPRAGAYGTASSPGYGVTSLSASRPDNNGTLPSTAGEVSYRKSSTSARSQAASGYSAGRWQTGAGSSTYRSSLSSDTNRRRQTLTETDEPASSGRTRPVRYNPDGTVRKSRFTAGRDLDDEDEREEGRVLASAVTASQPRRDYSRIFMIVGCVLAVVLIVVLIRVIFVSDAGDSNSQTTQPVSGLTDPEQAGQSTTTNTTTITPIKPTAAYFSIQVSSTATEDVYMEIYTSDGTESNEYSAYDMMGYNWTMAETGYYPAGTRKQYDVTELMYVYVNHPGDVSLSVNGQSVEWQKDGWRSYYLVNFPEILEAWEAENSSSSSSES